MLTKIRIIVNGELFLHERYDRMAKVNYYLSSKVDKQTGKAPILIRFIGGRGLIFRIKSRYIVNPKRWNSKEGSLILPRIETVEQKDLVQLNKRLSELSSTIVESFTSTPKNDISKDWLISIVDRFHNPDKYISKENDLSFFELFDKFLEVRKLSMIRRKNYGVIVRALLRFQKFKTIRSGKPFSLEIDKLNVDTINEIENFFTTENEISLKYPDLYNDIPECRTIKARGKNTVGCNMTKLRTFINWCISQGYTNNKPFIGYEAAQAVYGTPYYITIEERNSIYNFDLYEKPQLEVQRDVFVFQCLVGCRISDLYSLTRESIINDAIEYIPRKTKEGTPVTVRVPLNQTAKDIVDKYKDIPGSKLFPFIAKQNYNYAIKDIFTLAGINRIVTVLNPATRQEEKRPLNEIASSHLARRTFVGNLYKKVKDPNLVGSLSGHKEGSRAFARYREIDEEMKRELVKLLD